MSLQMRQVRVEAILEGFGAQQRIELLVAGEEGLAAVQLAAALTEQLVHLVVFAQGLVREEALDSGGRRVLGTRRPGEQQREQEDQPEGRHGPLSAAGARFPAIVRPGPLPARRRRRPA